MSHPQIPEKSPVPAHVPAALVHDFDLYNVEVVDGDYHGSLKRLQAPGVPDIFWTPRHGGHWVAARGEDIYEIFKDHERFSSRLLVVPRHRNAAGPAAADLARPARAGEVPLAVRAGAVAQGRRAAGRGRAGAGCRADRGLSRARGMRVRHRVRAAPADRHLHAAGGRADFGPRQAARVGRPAGAPDQRGGARPGVPRAVRLCRAEGGRAQRQVRAPT